MSDQEMKLMVIKIWEAVQEYTAEIQSLKAQVNRFVDAMEARSTAAEPPNKRTI